MKLPKYKYKCDWVCACVCVHVCVTFTLLGQLVTISSPQQEVIVANYVTASGLACDRGGSWWLLLCVCVCVCARIGGESGSFVFACACVCVHGVSVCVFRLQGGI